MNKKNNAMSIKEYLKGEIEIPKEIIKKTHCAMDALSHYNVRKGRSTYVSHDVQTVKISTEEAHKAISLGIRIGYKSSSQIHHGSNKGDHFFVPIATVDELNRSKIDFYSDVIIDPAYGYLRNFEIVMEKIVKK